MDLEQHLRQSRPDHAEVLATLPADPRLRAAALATVLGLDALKAMRGDVPTDQLLAERDERENATRAADDLFRAQGAPIWPKG
ncbi:hypothetical protein AB0J83_45470 [Actinoplanes sp. NPDC049596]|uniref:hypothetical protein n=1 Tax=unclassified Actinoplanes TaxID=2626549 RepID=UPI003448F0F7